MYEKQLFQIGLSEKETVVYGVLLNLGKSGIGQILKKTPYKRGDVYNIMYSLVQKGLISENKERGKKIFILENPDKLNELINNQEKYRHSSCLSEIRERKGLRPWTGSPVRLA